MLPPARRHWPEYLIEAAGLCAFMMSACAFGALLEHPVSSIHQALPDPFVRRIFMGVAMGLTAIAIIYSPWGRRSGAHINPSVTLAFLRLGRIDPADAAFYVAAQFAGGAIGVGIAARFLAPALADPAVNYVVTVPGSHGTVVAFLSEATISFVLFTAVLWTSNTERLARWTGLFCGILVALYISFEAPISGMSMNPARTLGSATAAHDWRALWIYFTAPPLGMLLAAETYLSLFGEDGVGCAKLDHPNDRPCIFCAYRKRRALEAVASASRRNARIPARIGADT
jgi:aquaporin Z